MAKERKGEDNLPARSPIPTRIVSNGEYFPPPQTERQKQLAALIAEMSEVRARKLGLSRRAFLKTSAGMATALVAANLVNGCRAESDGGFMVPMQATYEEDCAQEVLRSDYFLVDVQTHHVDLEVPILQDPTWRETASCLRAGPESCTELALALIGQFNFIKEVFVDSETAVAVISGLGLDSRETILLPVSTMAQTRDIANALGCSERMISQGVITPVLGPEAGTGTAIQDLEYQVRELRVPAIKCYTSSGNPATGVRGWWLDDERISYPMLREARRLGLKNICVHKGLAMQSLIDEFVSTRDIPRVATDWPDLNFIVYHSGFDLTGGTGVDEFIENKRRIPNATNVYAEIGSTFAWAMMVGVEYAGHILGKLLRTFGADRILWGTDSVWWGSPQWQINMFKTFRIPDRLVEQEGYPQITNQIRAQIFGLNSAHLYNLNPTTVRYRITASQLQKSTEEYREHPNPSNRRYGPVNRREVIQAAARSAFSSFGAMLKGKVTI